MKVERIQDIPSFEILVMNSINQAAQGGVAQAAAISGMSTGIGFQQGNPQDLETARRALREKLNEGGSSLACTILRKKIKDMDAGDEESKKIERVIFCSDQRQIKNFNKRKNKHEGKITRVKKTSLKDKMHTSKQALDRLMRDRKSETSSVGVVRQLRVTSHHGSITVGN